MKKANLYERICILKSKVIVPVKVRAVFIHMQWVLYNKLLDFVFEWPDPNAEKLRGLRKTCETVETRETSPFIHGKHEVIL